MKKLLHRIRFALSLNDRDLENIAWMCDRIIIDSQRPINDVTREELTRLYTLVKLF